MKETIFYCSKRNNGYWDFYPSILQIMEINDELEISCKN